MVTVHSNATQHGVILEKGPCTTLVQFQPDFGPSEYANHIQNTTKLQYIITVKIGSKSDCSSVNLAKGRSPFPPCPVEPIGSKKKNLYIVRRILAVIWTGIPIGRFIFPLKDFIHVSGQPCTALLSGASQCAVAKCYVCILPHHTIPAVLQCERST